MKHPHARVVRAARKARSKGHKSIEGKVVHFSCFSKQTGFHNLHKNAYSSRYKKANRIRPHNGKSFEIRNLSDHLEEGL